MAVRLIGSDSPQWQLLNHLNAAGRLSGRSLVLWQPPASFDRKLIHPGERHDTVRWVRQAAGHELAG